MKKYKIKNIKVMNNLLKTDHRSFLFLPNQKKFHVVFFKNKKMIYPIISNIPSNTFSNITCNENKDIINTKNGYIKICSNNLKVNDTVQAGFNYLVPFIFETRYVFQVTHENDKVNLFEVVVETRINKHSITLFDDLIEHSDINIPIKTYIDNCENMFLQQRFKVSKILKITSLLSTSTFSSLNNILQNEQRIKDNKFAVDDKIDEEKHNLFKKITYDLENLEINCPGYTDGTFTFTFNKFLRNKYILSLFLNVKKNKEKKAYPHRLEIKIRFSNPNNNKIYVDPCRYTNKDVDFKTLEFTLYVLQKTVEYFKNNQYMPMVEEYKKKVKEIKDEYRNDLKNMFKQFENTKDLEYILMKIDMLYDIKNKNIQKVWEVSLDESN
jgi:hypothetical protein